MTDDATAALEQIRECNDRVIAISDMGPAAVRHLAHVEVPHLVAAIEAVLKAHRPLDRGRVMNCCVGCEAPNGDWHEDCCHEWPCPTVEAISRELTGKESNGA